MKDPTPELTQRPTARGEVSKFPAVWTSRNLLEGFTDRSLDFGAVTRRTYRLPHHEQFFVESFALVGAE